MPTYSAQRLSHGEQGVSALIEIFGVELPESLTDLIVEALDARERRFVSMAIADLTGQSGYVRDEYRIGRMPKIDEILARVRHHELNDAELKRLKTTALPEPKFEHTSTPERRKELVANWQEMKKASPSLSGVKYDTTKAKSFDEVMAETQAETKKMFSGGYQATESLLRVMGRKNS